MSRLDDWATHLDPGRDGADITDDERSALERIDEALSDQAMWTEPPTDIRDRLLAEAGSLTASQSNVVPIDAAPSTSTRMNRRWWTLGTAAVVAAVLAVVVALGLPASDPPSFELAGTTLAPGAGATAAIEPLGAGVAITLEIVGLPAAGPGEYYAAWLTDSERTVGIGSFHWREGGIPIELWSGVDTSRYPMLMVTLQQEAAPPIPSGETVLQGRVVPGS